MHSLEKTHKGSPKNGEIWGEMSQVLADGLQLCIETASSRYSAGLIIWGGGSVVLASNNAHNLSTHSAHFSLAPWHAGNPLEASSHGEEEAPSGFSEKPQPWPTQQ